MITDAAVWGKIPEDVTMWEALRLVPACRQARSAACMHLVSRTASNQRHQVLTSAHSLPEQTRCVLSPPTRAHLDQVRVSGLSTHPVWSGMSRPSRPAPSVGGVLAD